MENITTIKLPPSPNFSWQLGSKPDNLAINFIVKKTWYNRWKWWVATKLFLPGYYKWIDNSKN